MAASEGGHDVGRKSPHLHSMAGLDPAIQGTTLGNVRRK